MNTFDKLTACLRGPEGPRPGLYHSRREFADRSLRLHLRIDPDGSGLLVVNASGVLHLNATAAFLAKLILDGASRDQAVRTVRRVYRVPGATVAADFDRMALVFHELETAEDACPVWRLDVPEAHPFEAAVKAPYRADLALNYACNNRCIHCYVPRRPDEKTPLTLDQWKTVLDRLWEAGIPHICFTGGEATLSPCLLDLIERAEDIGQVTGLLTNGRRLADRDFVRRLCAAGLDHVQITLESHEEAVHDRMVGAPGAFRETVAGIRNAVDEDIYLLTNTTVCRLNTDNIEATISFIASLGVRQFAVNSFIQTGAAPASGEGLDETELDGLLARITAMAGELGLRFIWYTPTHYCRFNPAEFGAGLKRCSAAEYNLCIEPDGDVIPCQSFYESAGNILRDPWPAIWQSPLFTRIRTRADVSETCRACPDFPVCGGGCPLSKGDRFLCTESAYGS
jgi:radical SAM protein with 4Fe4S-binding SPASM domain